MGKWNTLRPLMVKTSLMNFLSRCLCEKVEGNHGQGEVSTSPAISERASWRFLPNRLMFVGGRSMHGETLPWMSNSPRFELTHVGACHVVFLSTIRRNRSWQCWGCGKVHFPPMEYLSYV